MLQLMRSNNVQEQAGKFQELLDQVLHYSMQPEDEYEVAAILESLGWNDNAARQEFGADDIFALARDLWGAAHQRVLASPLAHVARLSTWQYVVRVIRSFLRGMIFALPMAVSVCAMLTLRFSLWSYEYFSLEIATSISIGTILSFVVIGGFTQALARRGFLYLGQGHITMARKTAYYLVRMGYLTCLAAAGLFLVVNWLLALYPWRMAIIVVLYLLFLSSIWLSVTVMYMLQKELTFTGIISAGILVVYVMFEVFHVNIMLSQLIALSLASVASVLFTYFYFLQKERKLEKGIAPKFKISAMMVYLTMPYFAYGLVYFAFLNLDRILAWSANNIYMPYFIWFRGDYELGLDFALLVLMLPMGLVEVVVNEIMANLEADQKNFMATEVKLMTERYTTFYRQRFVLVGIFCLLNGLAVFLLIKFLDQGQWLQLKVFADPTTLFVFCVAIVAYSLLAMALMNVLILFSLSQPRLVYGSILQAVGTNFVVGFLLSRWVNYQWAVIGLLIGSVIFLITSSKRVMEVLKNLDFYLYKAL